MASKKPNAAAQLKAVSDALKCDIQKRNALKEIEDKIQKLENSKRGIQRCIDECEEVLNADPELTAVARSIMKQAISLRGAGDDEMSVYNPNYVTTEDKERLLAKIIADYQAREPQATSVPYRFIRNELVHKYHIGNASTALFFRNQLKEYETEGGNKNKAIVLQN